MRYCRYQTPDGPRFGRIEGTQIVGLLDLPEAPSPSAAKFWPMALDQAALLAPVVPGKIICVGRNYRDHASELGHEAPAEPLLFFKPVSALLEPEGAIRRPPASISQRVDFEGELALVIGKPCYRLSPQDDVRPYVRGFTCANDVTARDLQNKDGQWARAKGCDTFCPVGPVVVGADAIDSAALELTTRLNGEVRQHGLTHDFIFDVPTVVRYISQVMTLHPGDLILTGTPAGVGPMQAGDTVEVEIGGIGVLRNTVA